MTEKSENHLKFLKEQIADLVEIKYTLGAQEHGGDLTDMPVGKLIDEAIQENIDSLVYLLTAKGKLDEFKIYTSNARIDIKDLIPGSIIMGSPETPTGAK